MIPTPSNPSSCSVSLLTPFEPARDPLDWTLGTHGIHITFHDPSSGRRYSGTYLPDVAVEQGWTKEEAVRSLVRKAGWRGEVQVGGELWRGIEMRTYRSEKCKRDWGDYVAWKGEKGL
jgi:AMMECR1 domain-containing protein